MRGFLFFSLPLFLGTHSHTPLMHYGQGEVERAVEILVNMGREKKELFFSLLLQEETADDRQVVVRNASLMTSGEFRCQVSGEGPLFATVTTSKMLRVAGTPGFF